MRIVALTFHDVVTKEESASSQADVFYRITTGELETVLSQLRRLGYQAANSKEFRVWQEARSNLSKRVVVLTFDDGYASHFESVAPLLLRYRFSGTFFVPAALVGRSGYMSWDQLRKLVFLGMEIGSHGLSHRPFTQLSRQQLDLELTGSKRLLEDNLGIPIRAIAAPGGFWSASVAEAVRRAGYEAAWVSTIGTNGPQTNPLALRRVVVRRPFSAERIVSMVEGWQPAFWWASSQQHTIQLLKRLLGVYRYEQLKRRLVPNA